MKVILANPRGFCAGVDRAILIVEKALTKYGTPVYVRHEIVHNKYVVNDLKQKGAIFVKELNDIPNEHKNCPVIFSAHGVPKSVPEQAKHKNLFYLDATCPLVSKVHREAERNFKDGLHTLLIGHANHPEVIGTMGQVPTGSITLIETKEDAKNFACDNPSALALVTQTTLSVDDTKEITDTLKTRFPDIKTPHLDDICYATTNRQDAIKEMAPKCDVLLVIGAPNSSNSNRLVEVAKSYGCEHAQLVQLLDEDDIPWHLLHENTTLGISAGASAPEILVNKLLDALREKFILEIQTSSIGDENITFKLPKELAS